MDSRGGTSNKPGDGVSGLRVMVVDDDPTCLKILEKMLRNCLYEVTTCSRAVVALSILRERTFLFDLVISDVHMPEMDGFELLKHIRLEMDLPVIMMSVDDKKEVVMKGVTHGACDYLIKPIPIEALRNIWQHVVRKKRNKLNQIEQSGSVEDNGRNRRSSEDVEYTSSVNEGSWKNSKKTKEEEDDVEERDDTSTLKRPRVVWSIEMHQQFVAAVNQLGIDKAVPKKILELMNVPGLTRESVASHLQKYRLYIRRLSRVSQLQSGLSTHFMRSQEANFEPIPSYDGLDLQALAATDQLPSNFATLQAEGLAGIEMPHLDQRNPFSTEASKLRFGASQQVSINNKQVDLYHGLPTTIEPEQLAHLHQSVSPSSSIGLQVRDFMTLPSLGTHSMTHNGTVLGQGSSFTMQMAQSRLRGQLLNEASGCQASGTSLPTGQHMFSDGIVSHVLGRNMTIVNGKATQYTPGSRASSLLNFQMNQALELPANGLPLGIARGVPGLQQTEEMFQDRGSIDVKGSGGITTSFGMFHEQPQGKNQKWDLQNLALAFEASQRPKPLPGMNFSVLVLALLVFCVYIIFFSGLYNFCKL